MKNNVKKSILPEQIIYNSWGDELKPGHETYWQDIGDIADLIGRDLEGWMSHPDPKTSMPHRLSSIKVSDIKEKFGRCRIYCHFMAPEYVLPEFNRKYITEHKAYSGTVPTGSYKEFEDWCWMRDARHYRNTYLKFKRLFPHYWDAISDDADYPELLCETLEELELLIDRNKKYWEDEKDYIEKIKEACKFNETKKDK